MFDASSRAGNYLIDFALHGKGCRQTVKKEILDDFFELLTSHSCEEEVKSENGATEKRRHFYCELGAIMITKS